MSASAALVGALCRLGAVQNPIIPIYRDREVGFVTKQAGTKLLIVPGTWRDFDYVAMAERIIEANDKSKGEVVVVVGAAALGGRWASVHSLLHPYLRPRRWVEPAAASFAAIGSEASFASVPAAG